LLEERFGAELDGDIGSGKHVCPNQLMSGRFGRGCADRGYADGVASICESPPNPADRF
jgi:hypothetical protein